MRKGQLDIRQRLATILILGGLLGLLVVGTVYVDAWFGSRQAIAAFQEATPEDATPEESRTGAPLAVLRIRRLDLEVPVFADTRARTLNRGAGVVTGTAFPGEPGHIAISAHRDSFFRPLKDIEIGDVIELELPDGLQQFRVDETFITDPLDVGVLAATEQSLLTLITCYPFYYVGFAPDRFIVRAVPLITDS